MSSSIPADCEDIAPLLDPFQDGELPPAAMKDVARHLAGCQKCEQAADGYSRLGQRLRDLAAASNPNLDGFAMAVQERIERLRPSLWTQLGRWFDAWRERLGDAPVLALTIAGAALLTVVIATPLARNLAGAGHRDALRTSATDAQALAHASVRAPDALAAAASLEPSTIISKLETSNPDVAVWSEPSQDTTVIWLPDQQP